PAATGPASRSRHRPSVRPRPRARGRRGLPSSCPLPLVAAGLAGVTVAEVVVGLIVPVAVTGGPEDGGLPPPGRVAVVGSFVDVAARVTAGCLASRRLVARVLPARDPAVDRGELADAVLVDEEPDHRGDLEAVLAR